MLSENIRNIRKAKGLSQEELAVKLNVVRQTVSKWEQGRSVPDADMLICISDLFETPVSTLLGETVTCSSADNLEAISEKLEIINLQLAQRKHTVRRIFHIIFNTLCVLILLAGLLLAGLGSPYLEWDFTDPETAVVGTFYHAFEWIFFRAAPIIFAASAAGVLLTRKKQ